MECKPVELQLFGPLSARINGRPLSHVRSRKTHWLLALFALRHGREVSRSWLAASLWPESNEDRAFGSLRTTVRDLRGVLETESWRLTAPTSRTLHLDLANCEVDVNTFDLGIIAGGSASIER